MVNCSKGNSEKNEEQTTKLIAHVDSRVICIRDGHAII